MKERSCRDDMESLGYVLLYFIHGSLPWQGLKFACEERRSKLILKRKENITTKELCDGLPKEFALYFEQVRSLSFEDKPLYSYLRGIFSDLFVHEAFKYDHVFNWTILKDLMTT